MCSLLHVIEEGVVLSEPIIRAFVVIGKLNGVYISTQSKARRLMKMHSLQLGGVFSVPGGCSFFKGGLLGGGLLEGNVLLEDGWVEDCFFFAEADLSLNRWRRLELRVWSFC